MSDLQGTARALCQLLVRRAMPGCAYALQRALHLVAHSVSHLPRTGAITRDLALRLRDTLLHAAATVALLSRTQLSRLAHRILAAYVARRAAPRIDPEAQATPQPTDAGRPRRSSIRLQLFSYR